MLKINNNKFIWGSRTYIMGIVNVTPDSFHDGGKFYDFKTAFAHAEQMIKDGVDIIDIGGESTKPFSEPVPLEEELKRVIPLIKELVTFNIPLSIDTYKAKVAEKALEAGASMINDISGLKGDSLMAKVAGEAKVPVVIMHIKGTPKTMQANPVYDDLIKEINDYFKQSIDIALKAGIEPSKIILDPGIGFGKTVEHNIEIIKRLNEFKSLGFPILLGPSRKSFIGKLCNDIPTEQRLSGTLASVVIGVEKGVDMVRVHDVKETKQALTIADKIYR